MRMIGTCVARKWPVRASAGPFRLGVPRNLGSRLCRRRAALRLREKPPRLTQIAQIRNLSPDQAACEYPVQVRGVVTYFQGKKRDPFFFVQDLTGGTRHTAFDAHLELNNNNVKLPIIPVGSKVELAGICSVSVDDDRQPQAFRLLLRSPSDVVLLSRLSWWSVGHALTTFGALAIVLLAVLAWVFMQRRTVKEQTRLIREWLQREAAEKAVPRAVRERKRRDPDPRSRHRAYPRCQPQGE